MDKSQKKEKEVDLKVSVEGYQKEITDTIVKITNLGTLEYLCTFIKLFLEKWG